MKKLKCAKHKMSPFTVAINTIKLITNSDEIFIMQQLQKLVLK